MNSQRRRGSGRPDESGRGRHECLRHGAMYFLNGALNLGDQFDAFFPAQIARVLSGGGVIPVLMHAEAG